LDLAEAPAPLPSETPTVATLVAPPVAHGLLQLQYLTVVRNAQPSPAESGFVLRRARATVDGLTRPSLIGYLAELEVAQGTLAPLDFFAELRPSQHWAIRFGQMRVPCSRNWL